MSQPGQAPPPAPAVAASPGLVRGAGGDGLRVLRGVALAGLGGALLLLAAGGGVAWRLSQAPLTLDWMAPRVEAAARERGVALSLSGLALGWSGFREPGAPLRVILRDLRLGPQERPVASAARAEASLALLPLVAGRFVPEAVSVEGARVGMVRDAEGVRLADGAGLSGGGASGAGGAPWLDGLREGMATDTRVEVEDRALGVTWAAEVPRVAVRREAGGVSGEGDATLSVRSAGGAASPGVGLHATLRQDAGQPGWSVASVRVDPVDPASLAPMLPVPGEAARVLAALDLPLAVSVEATLDPALSPRHFGATLDGGAGQVVAGGASVGVSAVVLRGEGTTEGATLTLERLAMAVPAGGHAAPPTFSGTASVGRDAEGLLGRVALEVDHAAFSELGGYWPPRLGRNARAWITGNITAGTAHDGHLDVTLRAAPDGSGLRVAGATGRLLGEDATLHWLRPVPPLDHIRARLTLDDPDTLSVATQGGTAREAAGGDGGVQVGAGMVRITGLSVKDQVAAIGMEMHGGLASLVRLLSHPKLRLLSEHPPGFVAPRGRFETRLDLTVPLETDLDADRIGLHARTRATQVHLGDVAAGQDIDDGTIELDVTPQGLSAHGTATVAHMPARLSLDMDFQGGGPGQVVQRATLRADGDTVRLGQAGLDLAGVVEGGVGLDARYVERRDGQATVAVAADLSAATLHVPLGWSKGAGAAAEARGVLVLDHGHLRGIERLHATAPGLLLQGRAETGTRGSVLHIEHATLGRTEANGTVRFPQRKGGAVRVDIAGPMLDLSGLLDAGLDAGAGSDAGAGPASVASAPSGRGGTPWALDARFARVLLGRGRSIAAVSAQAEDDGRRLDSARLRAGEGVASLRADLSAQAGAGRHIGVEAEDAGALLSSLNVTDQLRGGRLTLGGSLDQDRPGHPVDATLRLDGFNVLGAAAAGRVLQGATLFGIVDLMHGPGLHVGSLDLPFRMEGQVIDLHDARATSASLGATAAGRIDLGAHSVEIAGTIVPAYLPNQLPGRLPVVGRLFSPEQGGGVFAATYTVRGALDDPKVSVNPLALLAPGFVRRLLGLP